MLRVGHWDTDNVPAVNEAVAEVDRLDLANLLELRQDGAAKPGELGLDLLLEHVRPLVLQLAPDPLKPVASVRRLEDALAVVAGDDLLHDRVRNRAVYPRAVDAGVRGISLALDVGMAEPPLVHGEEGRVEAELGNRELPQRYRRRGKHHGVR